MKFIDHVFPKIERIDSPEGRLYKTPSGNLYPSVTSVVGILHEDHIKKWKEEVGDDVANKISAAAAKRGTLIHENCENYIKGKQLTFTMFQEDERRMFNKLKPILESIDEVHALESQMFSDKLKVAGTVDLIVKLKNGELFVLDWKTSGRFKHEAEIEHYFMQCSAYAMMFYEHTKIAISKLKICMVTEEHGLLSFDKNIKDWLPKFMEIRQQYDKLKLRNI